LKTVAFHTLGCKVNTYDSTYMQSLFIRSGFAVVPFGESADINVINTCTVTAVADKKSRAAIRRAAKTGKVIVCGCMAQKQARQVLEMEGVSAVIGTDGRGEIAQVAARLLLGEDKIDCTKELAGCGYEPMSVSDTAGRTRGIIKIQEGCSNYCSYCIIPFVRGNPRSRAFSDIAAEAERMAAGGTKELVLTGIHIASYADEGKNLGDVIARLDELGVRIRLGSVEPGVLGKAFVEQIGKTKNLCPHFHISLQSGSAAVLERMNRRYTPEEYMAFADMLRGAFDKPAITTDIIAGFPGETDEEHDETLAFAERMVFSRTHVFPFSAREGTAAADMHPKIPKRVAKQRAAELIALGEKSELQYLQSMAGREERVLFEEPSIAYEGLMEGYAARYFRVAADAQKNTLQTVTLGEICDKIVLGQATKV